MEFRDSEDDQSTHSESDIRPYVEYHTVDSMIDRTGGFGKLQILILITMLVANIPTAFYAHGLPVLEQHPDYIGSTDGGIKYRGKSHEIGYKGVPNPNLQWEINWSSSRSIKNWIYEMDLMCYPKFKIGLFGSIFFLGFAISGLFLKFADHYGRRRVIQAGCLLSGFVVTYLYAFPQLYIRYIMLFFLGVISFRLIALYMLLMELSPKDYQMYVIAGYALIDHYIGVIVPSLYFRLIGDDYKVVFMIAVFTAPISFVLSMFLPESPRYYYEKRRIDDVRSEFKSIAEYNNVSMPQNYEIIMENGVKADNDDNRDQRFVGKMLKDQKILLNLLVIVLTFGAISFTTNLVNFHSKYFKANGYDMAFLMCHGDIIGTGIAVVFRKIFSTKPLITLGFAILSLCTIPLIFISEVDAATMVAVVGCQIGISIGFYLAMLAVPEVFPPLFVAFTFFGGNFCSSLTSIFTPLIAELAHPVPMRAMFLVSIGLGLLNMATLFSNNYLEIDKPKYDLHTKEDDETHLKRD